MKKKPGSRELEKWAMPHLLRLQKILLLQDFQPVSIEYDKELRGDIYMSCHMAYPYKSITITYSDSALKEMWEKKDYRGMRNCLAHEMSHPLTDPLYSKATDRYITKDAMHEERERLTDHIANILIANKLV